LAPGGHLGRLVVFTTEAFKALNQVFSLDQKKGYHYNQNTMNCADLARIINSDQIQAKLRDMRESHRAHDKTKKNPLTNKNMMRRLNPYASKLAELRKKAETDRHAKRAATLKAKRSKAGKKDKTVRNKTYQKLQDDLKVSFRDAEKVIEDEEKAGNYMPGDTSEEEDEE